MGIIWKNDALVCIIKDKYLGIGAQIDGYRTTV